MATELQQRIQDLVGIVAAHGHQRRAEPFQLASGEWSHDFVDVKLALARGDHLRLACQTVLEMVTRAGVDFDSVGGLTMGADQLSYGIAIVSGRRWFVVRKEPKGRGTDKLVEGGPVGPGNRVLVVDDVVTTGGSLFKAIDAVAATGATVVAASTVVDRGDRATAGLVARGVPYFPLMSWADLGIAPVGRPG